MAWKIRLVKSQECETNVKKKNILRGIIQEVHPPTSKHSGKKTAKSKGKSHQKKF